MFQHCTDLLLQKQPTRKFLLASEFSSQLSGDSIWPFSRQTGMRENKRPSAGHPGSYQITGTKH